MVRWRRLAPGLIAVVACSSADDAPPSATPHARMPAAIAPPAPVTLTLPASARDSSATLDSLRAFVERVDADTARMTAQRGPIVLGAGAAGEVVAWRAGSVWQRIHVDATGTGFTTSDTYWLHRGQVLAAVLERRRPGQRPAIDRVWFRDTTLFRWVDPAGRRLRPEVRSTQSEVAALRARIERITTALPQQTTGNF